MTVPNEPVNSPLQLALPTSPIPLALSHVSVRRQGTEFKASQIQQKHGQGQSHVFSFHSSFQTPQGLCQPIFFLSRGMHLGSARMPKKYSRTLHIAAPLSYAA